MIGYTVRGYTMLLDATTSDLLESGDERLSRAVRDEIRRDADALTGSLGHDVTVVARPTGEGDYTLDLVEVQS